MGKSQTEGQIIGAKLRKRAAVMYKHGANPELIGVIIEAADRLARLGRENELLKRKIQDRGLFGPLSGVAIGLAPFCKHHACHIVRTIDGGFRAIRTSESVPAGWRVLFDVERGTKAATIFTNLKQCAEKIDAEPIGAKRKRAVRSAEKKQSSERVGRIVRNGDDQAQKIADLIFGPVDLYRLPSGIRVVKAGANVKQGEFLGRFDEGATYQDIVEAIT